ncbi:hypothetical protein A3K93_13440 (plasmid) [Acinetobacter sp. NCu2D-2]|uniref:ABC transporter permease n=1 Tax=Acinetobacter sp. NCu2D-2 TaxID=1608473 RepID=UPI0007CDCD60|nr:ABC transporter permease subunit [Acinetobacter sp. NCu2D-2]ANF83244.1 hypothetical protein A3K93_13440 [Acinetobacter sp. NCu2D-2]
MSKNNDVILHNYSATASTGAMSQLIAFVRTYSRKWWLIPFFLLIAILFVWPLIMMVAGGFKDTAPFLEGHWTLAAWSTVFDNPGLIKAVWTSTKLAFITTLSALFIASIFAFITERTDLKIKKVILPTMALIFVIPMLFYTIAFTQLANPYTGLINDFLAFSFGIETTWLDAKGWLGIYSVIILKKVAFSYLFIVGAFKALDATQDEASYVAGAGQLKTFFYINLPSLLPALTSIALLGLISGLQVFEPVLILGSADNIVVISTHLMNLVSGARGMPSYAEASILSTIFVAIVTLIYLLQIKALGRKKFYSISGKGARSRLIRLPSPIKWLVSSLLFAYLILALILPLGALLFSSVQPYPGIYTGFSFDRYIALFDQPRILSAFKVTITLGTVVGFAVMILALSVIVIGQKLKPKTWAAVKFSTLIPLAMPGIVSTVAVTWAYLSIPGFTQMYGTIWLVILALIVTGMPLASQLMNAIYGQLSPSLTEAARICGASGVQSFFEISLRLVLPSFVAGWFMTAIMVAGNLEVPLLLKAPGLSTLAMVSYNIQSAGDYSMASALLILTLLFCLTLFALSKGLQYLLEQHKKSKTAQFFKQDLS